MSLIYLRGSAMTQPQRLSLLSQLLFVAVLAMRVTKTGGGRLNWLYWSLGMAALALDLAAFQGLFSLYVAKHVGLLGASLNAVATLGNGGYMPARGVTETKEMWQPIHAGTRFVFLCDVLPGG